MPEARWGVRRGDQRATGRGVTRVAPQFDGGEHTALDCANICGACLRVRGGGVCVEYMFRGDVGLLEQVLSINKKRIHLIKKFKHGLCEYLYGGEYVFHRSSRGPASIQTIDCNFPISCAYCRSGNGKFAIFFKTEIIKTSYRSDDKELLGNAELEERG